MKHLYIFSREMLEKMICFSQIIDLGNDYEIIENI